MSQRTTRSRKTEGPLLTLEDMPKTITAQKLNDDQKERLRIFVNAYLMKKEGHVKKEEIMQFLEEKCIGKSVQKEFQVICDIYNSGVSVKNITDMVGNYIKNIQKRDVSTLAMFPEGNIRLTMYKQMTYEELMKYFKNDLNSLTEEDKKEFVLALNDPDSILFQSVLAMIDVVGTDKGIKIVQDIITVLPKFDINTNKDGKTLFMVAVMTLMELLDKDELNKVKKVLNFIKFLANQPSLVPNIKYNTIKFTATPVSLLYYIIYENQDSFNDSSYNNIFKDILDPLVKKWKLPAFYITGLPCPGNKCYGVIKTKRAAIDNLWFAYSFDTSYIKMLKDVADYDIKAGHGTKDLKNTLYFQNKDFEKEITSLERENTNLSNKINSVRDEMLAIQTILANLNKEHIRLREKLRYKEGQLEYVTSVYNKLTEEGVI